MLALCMSLLALLLHPRAQHQFYGTNRRNFMQMNHPIKLVRSLSFTVWKYGIDWISQVCRYEYHEEGADKYQPYPINLNLCEGDCDSDSDCSFGLKCFQDFWIHARSGMLRNWRARLGLLTNLKLVPCTSLPGLLLLPRKMSQLLRHGSKKRNWLHRMRPCRVNLVRRLRYMVIQLS